MDIDAQRGRGKYERHGGPSWAAIAELLDAWAASPLWMPSTTLVRLVTFTVVTANADAHGKNVALLHPEPGVVALAPAYDTVPTALWPRLRTTAAMRVSGIGPMDAITLEHVVAEAASWPHAATRARRVAAATCEQLRDAARDGVAGHQQVTDLVSRRATALLDGRPAGDR